MSDYKIIHDTIHGSIKLSGLLLELLETPEVQKLSGIHQLGLAYQVFPGANHTRLEHSLGTSHVADRIVSELGLSDEEKLLVTCAALLHDIGHGPYSHTLEMMVHHKTGMSHEELTGELIRGNIDILEERDVDLIPDRRMLPGMLEKYGLEPDDVANLIHPTKEQDDTLSLDHFNGSEKQGFFNSKMYLTQVIHGEIDSDQIDYLLRDSHYTGIAHGTIDADRLIRTMEVYNNDLVIHRRGLPSVEGMLVARSLMYSSIYFHKTVRIAELMLARAVEHAEEKEERPPLERMVDYDLLNFLDGLGGFPQEIVRKLKYRRLYKRVYSVSSKDLNDGQRSALAELSDWENIRSKEDELCDRMGIPPLHLFVDIPKAELALSEPRLRRTQVKILDKDLKPLSSYSPLARALQLRPIPDWELMVAIDPEYHDSVSAGIEKILFN